MDGAHPEVKRAGPGSWREWVPTALLVALYFAAYEIAFRFPVPGELFATFWPPSGIALGGMLLLPRKKWPIALAAFAIVGGIADVLENRWSLGEIAGFLLANGLETGISAWCITAMCGHDVRFSRTREIFALATAVLGINAATAALGAFTFYWGSGGDIFSLWRSWFMADGFGMLLITPLLVVWGKSLPAVKSLPRAAEALIFFLLLGSLAWVLFATNLPENFFLLRPYLLFAMMTWASMRLGMHGVTLACASIAVFSLGFRGSSPLIFAMGDTEAQRLISIEMFIAALSFVGFLLTVTYSQLRSTERLARSGQERLNSIADNIPGGVVFQLRRDKYGQSNLTYLSGGLTAILQLTHDAVIGRKFLFDGMYLENGQELIERAIQASTRDLSPLDVEVQVLLPDNTPHWFHVTAKPKRLGDGTTVWHGLALDVTVRKNADEALRAKELRLRTLVENMPAGALLRMGEDIFFNPEAARIVGYFPEELPTLTDWFAALYGPDTARIRDAYELDRSAGFPESRTVEITRKDRQRRKVNFKGQLVGEERLEIWVLQDVTEREVAEQRLRASQQFSQGILDAMGFLTAVIDQKGDIVTTNVAWRVNAERMGAAPERVCPGVNYLDICNRTQGSGREYALQAIEGIKKVLSGAAERHEFEYPCSGKWFVSITTPLRSERGVEAVVCHHDVTALRLAERERIEEHALLQSIIDEYPGPITVKDLNGVVTLANKRTGAVAGLPREALIGKTLFDIMPREFAESRWQKDREVQRSGLTTISDEEAPDPDGTLHTYVTSRFPIVRDNKVVASCAIATDISDRKKIENELAAQKEQLRVFVEQCPAALAMFDCDMRYLAASQRWASDYDLGDIQIKGRTHYEVFPEIGDRWKAIHQRCLLGNVERCEEEAFVRADGRTNWLRWEIRPWRDVGGEIGGLLLFSEDITERIEFEHARRESEGRFRALIEDLDVGVVLQDTNDHILVINRAAQEILGIDEPESREVSPRDERWNLVRADGQPLPAEDVPSVVAARTGRPVNRAIIGTSNLSTGQRRWLNVTATPRLDKNGSVSHVLVSLLDITSERSAEQAAREQANFIERITDLAPVAIYVYDFREDKLRFINKEYSDIFGYSLEELRAVETGRDLLKLLCEPDQIKRWSNAQRRMFAAPDTNFVEGEYRAKTRHGEEVWVSVVETPLKRAENGYVEQTLGIALDITERKAMDDEREHLRAQLTQAQKLESIGRLAGGIAHDFNNMLQIILSHAALAMHSVSADSSVRDDLKAISRAAESSAALTSQLLGFARKQPITPRPLDMNAAIINVLGMLRTLVGEAIEVRWRPGPDVWPVMIDPSQVDQILTNFCANARDAIENTGVITIETRNVTLDAAACAANSDAVPGDYLELIVSDTGRGMDEETLQYVFEPFFTTKGVGAGTGLGLASVYGIARQNGGLVQIFSRLDHGTTCHVYLPRCDERPIQSRPIRTAESGTETILLVEDEPNILKISQRMLTDLGYNVYAAKDAREAITIASSHLEEIDLLITDVVMPEMNGNDLSLAITALRPAIRCLFMSGHTADLIGSKITRVGDFHFLQKPFSAISLAKKVREALAESASARNS